MRPIIIAVCLLAAGCGSDTLNPPTAPSGPAAASAQLPVQSGARLPLAGTLNTRENGVVAPPNLLITGTGEGTATQLGLFTATITDVVDLASADSTGTLNLTAANGDRLFTTTAGGQDEVISPGVVRLTQVATIVGGTGRFATATGTFTWRRIGIIDFATATSTSSGSFEGTIDLDK